jgi:hypothetical protein
MLIVRPDLAAISTGVYNRWVRYFRMFLWLSAFVIATFCWVVVIEHGPENFVAGSKIEIENLGSLASRIFR